MAGRICEYSVQFARWGESLGAIADGEYASLVEALMEHGYAQSQELRRFQLARSVPAKDGGPPIEVIVYFLMPRDRRS